MKVFVTGGTGYIGQAVALRLKKAGHEVLALVRNKDKAAELAKAQVKLVQGELGNPAGFAASAYGCAAVVHCAQQQAEGGVDLDRRFVLSARDLLRGQVGATLVYTSGCLVYGETGDTVADETFELKPPKALGWRPGHEKLALEAAKDGIRSIVVRPGWVWGGRAGAIGGFFASAAKGGAAQVVGDGRNRWPMVHLDDLAELYVRLVERAPAGSVFNATDPSRLTVKEIAAAASRAAGKGGEISFWPVDQARVKMGVFADAMCVDQRLSSEKAQSELDWRPRHADFASEAEAVFAQWKSLQ